jgi:hypothetical protein
MHQLATIPNKPTIAAVRALVRDEGSSLLDEVTDTQIDAAIKQNIDRPAATVHLLAGSAKVIEGLNHDPFGALLRSGLACATWRQLARRWHGRSLAQGSGSRQRWLDVGDVRIEGMIARGRSVQALLTGES